MEKVANISKRRKSPAPMTALVRLSGAGTPPTRITAPFAVTHDGEVFLNVAHCAGRALEGRRHYTFTGVLLDPEEAELARGATEGGAADIAAQIVAGLPSAWTLPPPVKRAEDKSPSLQYGVRRKSKAART